jgi:hypothetical protein
VASPAIGDSCDGDPSADGVIELECPTNSVCVEDTLICTARNLGAGAVCDISEDLCSDGFFCDFLDGAVDATCQADADDGFLLNDPCTEDCGGRFSGLACVNATCVLVTPVQPGGACDSLFVDGDVVNYCVNQIGGVNTCVDEELDGSGICTALPATGPCLNGDCAREAVCNQADVCQALPGAGQECINFDCADGFVCDSTTDPELCAALPGAGQPCIDGACADDLDCNDVDVCEAQVPLVCPQ